MLFLASYLLETQHQPLAWLYPYCVLVSWSTGHPRKTECLRLNRLFHFSASVSIYLLSSHIGIVLISETYAFWTPCTMSRFWWGPSNSVSGVWQGLTNTVSRFWQADCFLIFQPHALSYLSLLVFTPLPPRTNFNICLFSLPLFHSSKLLHASCSKYHWLDFIFSFCAWKDTCMHWIFLEEKTVRSSIILQKKVASVLWRLQSILLLVVCDVSASQPSRPLLSRNIFSP